MFDGPPVPSRRSSSLATASCRSLAEVLGSEAARKAPHCRSRPEARCLPLPSSVYSNRPAPQSRTAGCARQALASRRSFVTCRSCRGTGTPAAARPSRAGCEDVVRPNERSTRLSLVRAEGRRLEKPHQGRHTGARQALHRESGRAPPDRVSAPGDSHVFELVRSASRPARVVLYACGLRASRRRLQVAALVDTDPTLSSRGIPALDALARRGVHALPTLYIF